MPENGGPGNLTTGPPAYAYRVTGRIVADENELRPGRGVLHSEGRFGMQRRMARLLVESLVVVGRRRVPPGPRPRDAAGRSERAGGSDGRFFCRPNRPPGDREATVST